jgi:hypothetical protein
VNLLDLVPIRAAGWDEGEELERVILIRPHPVAKGLRAPLEWLAYLLAPRRLKLDEFGSFCWLSMDGVRTAGEIASLLRNRFGSAAEPAEERLGRFIHMLQREELVTVVARPVS